MAKAPIDAARQRTLESLENHGVVRLNAEGPVPVQRTMVVVGSPRGGTSMIAAALHGLGVWMGDRLSPVYENVPLSEAFEQGDMVKIGRLVGQCNEQHAVWGWKRPSSADYLKRVDQALRNPRYVIVFRDLLAIGNRNHMAVGVDLIANMSATLRHYRRIVSFLESSTAPCLLISYEKALQDRERFVGALAKFAGLDGGANLSAAAAKIQASPPEYLLGARLRQSIGFLDQVTRESVSGWARFEDGPEPVQVEILVNGAKVGASRADRPRPDVKAQGLHPTGACGFLFWLPQSSLLRDGDAVRVRVLGARGDVDLRNSPRTFGS
ncbi:MAG: hypothetical protein HOI95_30100 [Chromatiales bacterium]|nr:hypothetical protein [Chromatiales bacterium]